MQGSKIRLSPSEAALLSNADIILTKNSILQKTVALLAGVQEELMMQPNPLQPSSPKISKGENYRGLPYVVLDYPRLSSGEDLLFIRSMFWWGNFFSSTLHIAGRYKQAQLPNLQNAYETLASKNYFIGVNQEPWEHHFEADNYRQIKSCSKDAFCTILEEMQHSKIAACWPLQQWDSAQEKLVESWKCLLAILEK